MRSHSNSTPVASRTRRVASASSGPVPSPGMKVTVCAMSRGAAYRRRAGSTITSWPRSASVNRPGPAPYTHEVANQAPPLEGCNLFDGPRAAGRGARARGRRLGARAAAASRAPPGAASRSSWGRRPTRTRRSCAPTTASATASTRSSSTRAWHELMALGVGHGPARLPWTRPRPGAHVARAALCLMRRPGRGRPRLPDHDDLRGGPGAARRSPSSPRSGSRC